MINLADATMVMRMLIGHMQPFLQILYLIGIGRQAFRSGLYYIEGKDFWVRTILTQCLL
jgi:hypothetical protein